MRGLTSVELKSIQKTSLSILKEFDIICRKNNLKYMLFAGTLLGAVRHKGFIPWDDDIDVAMPREDYNKFLEIVYKNKPEDLFVQNFTTEFESNILFTKLKKDGTLFLEVTMSEQEIHHGIFIDIFPLDSVSKSNYYLNPNLIVSNLMFKYLIARTTNFTENENILKSLIRRLIKKTNFINISALKIKISKTIQGSKEPNFYNHLTNGISKSRFNRYLVSNEVFDYLIELEFEGINFYAPSNYDDVLTRLYGDYMKLPKESDRLPTHKVVDIKLEEHSE